MKSLVLKSGPFLEIGIKNYVFPNFIFDYLIFFSLLIKKQPFTKPKKQTIYDYLSEFSSEALHIVIFENFVKINDLLLIEIESYLYFASLSKSLTTQVTIIQTFLHCRPEAISYKGRKTFFKSKGSKFANWFKLEREVFLQKITIYI